MVSIRLTHVLGRVAKMRVVICMNGLPRFSLSSLFIGARFQLVNFED